MVKSLRLLFSLCCAVLIVLCFGPVAPAWAADLRIGDVRLAPCDQSDPGAQPGPSGDPRRAGVTRTAGASCYVLSGTVDNPARKTIYDTDVYARILDASGEPVLQNRTRVGSIGDVEPGDHPFALRLAVPAGTPGPFEVSNARARGFGAPVRTRATDEADLLPLEQQVMTPRMQVRSLKALP
ncbi:MAG: hypothetical protein VKK03_02875 [Synechococcus sp.]|nr:hypothetical protein [Synechococcus sp.]